MPEPESRRAFLRRAAFGAGGMLLAACTANGGGRVPITLRPAASPPPPLPAVDPLNDPVARIDTRWPIKRVVYLMLENRSFDNMFGAFPGANGAGAGAFEGKEILLRRCPEWLPEDLPHDHGAAVASVNGGRMDHFAFPEISPASAAFAYSRLHRSDVPNYWRWAEEFVLCDNFFASVLGPSHPNHLFFVAGQSGGTFDNPENARPVPVPEGGRSKSWGCDSPEDVYIYVRHEDGSLTTRRPCFRFTTVGDQLTNEGIPWAYYAANRNQQGYIWSVFNSFDSVFETDLWDRHIRPVDNLLADIDAGALPAVTWITPRFELSDHPPWSSSHAHNWVTAVVNGIMRSHMWDHTAIFVTWDEWGGFYDHVPPPQIDQVGLGIRVPMLVVSPYAKRGYVDHELGEFSSPLRFIQDNWGLRHHTQRIRKTHNFAHVFDFRRKPRDPDIRPKVEATGRAFVHPETFRGWPPEFR